MIRDTLLIIDDSELDLAILNEIFKKLFRVECVSDARRGLTFLHHHGERVCAVLLDICLERRGAGFTVLHQLQGNPDTSALPVILITTDAIEKDVRTSVERGAVDFLVKPVDPHTVQERVCSVVRSAWPPASTILDQKAEQEPEPPQPTETVQIFPEGLRLDQARMVCREWTGAMESFFRLRTGMDLAASRQLGAIAGVLARCYVRQFPQKGLQEEDAELIGMAAAFCDIGLLGVPDRVAEKGEDQEESDAQIYYQHTRLGYELFTGATAGDVPLLRYAAEIALWHHKNVDGSGYPQDGDGTAIPLSAQITRTALRIQRYLNYYRGCADGVERMLRTLKSEAGTVIAPELYETAELSREEIRSALQTS